ncbi:oxidoreductase [Bradyrhizobium sp. SSBR45G]|uniref:NAD(P)/FAD-dependent oxidoreductase n=1 Tax=unclassified Bradyrhizobium TaxID=2631580 RepID=UPI0023429BE0|nr:MULTISPECIES: FAD-dependent oxidoreductase [unclassified Bradyrhizobium]GLH79221.1 oxidoreductase [Bradyrhizobium sp. SSBR45G]GLH84656.1 oxidoreductase [Bradyrhizobium sp. SSBR45R]
MTSFRCDILIVGAGITGAMMAERLTRQGREVVLIDREKPCRGSTAASTAMLLWEIDRSLNELALLIGFDRAARCYQASLRAVNELQRLILERALPGQLRPRQSLYLARDDDARSLRDELALRVRAGLPGVFLDHRALLDNFGFARAAAILSPGAAEADPVQLASGLLSLSLSQGARLVQGDAVAFDAGKDSVVVGLDGGHEIEARRVVLATGYAMPRIIQPTIQRVASSWAIATVPQPQNLWKDEVLIWEASEDYHYARTTPDGRIIFGGEDDDELIEPATRDRAIPEKSRRLAAELSALWPRAILETDYQWSGTFDTTDDGLPLIGAVPGFPNIFAAYGYGGNGITFSYLASELIAALIAGRSSPLLDDFAIERVSPARA